MSCRRTYRTIWRTLGGQLVQADIYGYRVLYKIWRRCKDRHVVNKYVSRQIYVLQADI
jgi:hypothetical protein